MMQLNYKLRTGHYKCTKLQEKINLLMYIDDIKIFAKNEKEPENLIQSDPTAKIIKLRHSILG